MPKYIDHINHNKTDNRIENLRDVTSKENSQNRRVTKINTHGVIGVKYRSDRGAWVASIWVDKKSVYIGYFLNFKDAVQARKKAQAKYGFHKNHGEK